MKIWDLHCHIAGASLPEKTPEERGDHLVTVMDRMGIERMCIFMGMRWSWEPTPEQLRLQNDEILRILEKHPDRFFGFTYVSPQHVDASLEEMERCIVKGPMVGIKLWIAAHCNLPEVDPIVRRAAELKAVIFQHTWFNLVGNKPGESTPTEFAELAARHPDITMICGHTGGDWEQGLQAVRHLPNVLVDLAGSDPVAGFTEMAVREMGADRVIYGSDGAGRSFASQLSKVYGAAIPEEQKQMILYGNLHRLMLPILKQKGIEG